MYSAKNNLLELLALLKAHAIRDIVLSPGSRNAPLIQSLVSDSFFTCHRVTDERSAGFFAIGIMNHTGRPAAVCCTSGTALLNLGPAVAEAFYQELPLVVLSADRTPAWIGQLDDQTLPQWGVFGKLVRKSVQLPEFKTPEDRWQGNRELNEAFCACVTNGCGPVHINIPLAEPLFDFSANELPEVRFFTVNTVHPPVPVLPEAEISDFKRILLIIGQTADESALKKELEQSVPEEKILVFSEYTGLSAGSSALANFDLLLQGMENADEQRPDLVITTGGHLISKSLKKWLRGQAGIQHWHVSEQASCPDLFMHVTRFYRTTSAAFVKELNRVLKTFDPDRDWLNFWKKRSVEIPAFIPGRQLSDLSAVSALALHLPANALLFSGNSSSIRNLHFFKLPAGTKVFCHRGVSGIEGTISSACGMASVTDQTVFVILGDLSFFYDLNALTIRPFPSNLRIVLINNKGGGIFRQLPGLEQTQVVREYVAASHTLEAEAWVKAAGLAYYSAKTREELQQNIEIITSEKCAHSAVIEVFTDESETLDAQRNYIELIRKYIQHV